MDMISSPTVVQVRRRILSWLPEVSFVAHATGSHGSRPLRPAPDVLVSPQRFHLGRGHHSRGSCRLAPRHRRGRDRGVGGAGYVAAAAADRHAGSVGGRRHVLPQPHGADGGSQVRGRRRLLRSRLRGAAARAVLQGDAAPRPRPRRAGAHPPGRAVERARAGTDAGGDAARRRSSATRSATT